MVQRLRAAWGLTAERTAVPGGTIGWREAFGVAVTWRQMADPTDTVAWVDELPAADLERGDVASSTAMLRGQVCGVSFS